MPCQSELLLQNTFFHALTFSVITEKAAERTHNLFFLPPLAFILFLPL